MPPAKKKPAKSAKPAGKSAGKNVGKTAVKKPAKAAPKAPAKKPAASSAKKATTAKPKAKAPAKSAVKSKPAAKSATKPAAAPRKPSTAGLSAPKKPAPSKGRPAPNGAGVDYKGFEPYQAKRGEQYMNEKQRDHFRDILRSWRTELMQEVDRTVTHMKDEAANFPDPADRATQEEEFSLELRTRDRERKLIKKIDATLELIEQDDYGYCEACGVEIGVQRLEARPTATLCIDCKTLAEIKEKQELG